MKSFLLGELVTIRGGGTPRRDIPAYWNGGIPWATVKDFFSTNLSDTLENISPEGAAKSATNIIPAGNIIIPTRMALGKAAINIVDVAINQDLKALIIKDHKKVDRDYLFRFLLSKASFFESSGKGATVKGIRLEVLRGLEIPLPPLAEQKRIAAILDKADAIRRKRQSAIKLADDLLRATFLDMFGDPVANPKGWEVLSLKKAGKVSTGSTPSSAKGGMFGGDIPFITPGDLENNSEVPKRFVTKDGCRNSRAIRRGSTLVCCIGATIGKVGIAGSYSAFNQQINAIEWNDSIDDQYGYWAMRFIKKLIIKQAITTTLPILKKSEFEKIEIPKPDKKFQVQFAKIARKTDQLWANNKTASLEAAQIFNSLTQRAFRGEL